MIHDLATELAADIESYLTADLCEVNTVEVTYGEPAAPASDGPCREIWVWIGRMEDDAELDASCAVRSRLTLNYRIYSCYSPEGEDGEEASECIYGLMSAVWCGLVRGKDTGDLMLLGDCDLITLGALILDQPSGGIVSATGSVTVDYECPAISE